MTGVATLLKGIMQAAHNFNRLNVDGVLFFKLMLLIAGNESEVVNVLVKVSQRKFKGVNAAGIKQGQRALVIGLKIVQGDAGEIGDDYIARNFIDTSCAREVLNIPKSLRLGLAQVFAKAFVFHQQDARPKQVNVAILPGDVFYRVLKARDHTTADTEDIEEFIPVGLLFRLFTFRARPLFEKAMARCLISFQDRGME
jgi:hypothetical protein